MESVIRSVDAAVVPLHGLRTVRDARRPFYEKGLGNAEVFEWKGGAYALHNKATSAVNVLVDFGQGNVLTVEPGCTVRLFAEYWRLTNGAGSSTVVFSLVPGAEFDANALAASTSSGAAPPTPGWTKLSALKLDGWLAANTDGITTTFRGSIYTDSAGALKMERTNGVPAGVVDLTNPAFAGYSQFFLGAYWVNSNAALDGSGATCNLKLDVKTYGHPTFPANETTFGTNYIESLALITSNYKASGGLSIGGVKSTAAEYAVPWCPALVPYLTAISTAVLSVEMGEVVLWGRP